MDGPIHSQMIKMGHFHEMHDGDIDRLIEIVIEERVRRHCSKHMEAGMQKSLRKADPADPKAPKPAAPVAATPAQPAAKPAAAPGAAPVADKPQRHASYKLLTAMESNAKTAKNAGVGDHFSAILHLSPATLAGCGNVCPASTEGCRKACLNTAGRGGMIKHGEDTNTVQEARARRTRQLHYQPDDFFKDLHADITKVKKYASIDKKTPVVRLNGTSDIAWEDFKPAIWGGKNVFDAHPDVQFYDYTKRPDRVMKNQHSNYHITFSQSEANHRVAERLLNHGHNVAVVFGGKELPKQYKGKAVISGDDHDLRFLDPKGGHVVGLKAKGDAKSDTSGFVVYDHEGNTLKEGPRQPNFQNKFDRITEGKAKKPKVG